MLQPFLYVQRRRGSKPRRRYYTLLLQKAKLKLNKHLTD